MNATLTALVNDVYTLTKRPDLEAETKLAVKRATLKIHQSDFFYRDLNESGVSFTNADYVQTLEARTLFPKFRSSKYIRKSDVNGVLGIFMEQITPAMVLDRYGYDKVDVFYGAGEVIQIKSSTLLQYILFGFYVNPDVTDDNFASWVATDHPYAIIVEAAVTVFKTIGYDEQAAVYQRLALEELNNVKASNIEMDGY
jgi:hypothetical protein